MNIFIFALVASMIIGVWLHLSMPKSNDQDEDVDNSVDNVDN